MTQTLVPTDLTPDLLRSYLEHINEDHALELLATALMLGAPRWATEAEMSRLEPEGFSVLVRGKGQFHTFEYRFETPALNADDLREILTDLMSQAEGQITPPVAPVLDADALEATLRARRSYPVSKLRPDPVPKDLLERCLDAARYAPNHGRTAPWRFVVISGQVARQELCNRVLEVLPIALPDAPESYTTSYHTFMLEAPVWIAIGLKPRREKPLPEWEELAAVSMAVQNLHLMAQALGLGGMWVSGKLLTHPDLAAHFGWQDAPDRLLGLFYLGFATQALSPRKYLPLEDVVSWLEE